MTKISDALTIALWITGASWLLALIAYVLDERDVILPAVVLGIFTGIAEWVMRRSSSGTIAPFGNGDAKWGSTTTESNRITIALFCAIILLITVYMLLRFPDLGAIIAQYNQF